MIEVASQVINRYVTLQNMEYHTNPDTEDDPVRMQILEAEGKREASFLEPIVVKILNRVEEIPHQHFQNHVSWLWPLLSRLVQTDSKSIRQQLARVLEARI